MIPGLLYLGVLLPYFSFARYDGPLHLARAKPTDRPRTIDSLILNREANNDRTHPVAHSKPTDKPRNSKSRQERRYLDKSLFGRDAPGPEFLHESNDNPTEMAEVDVQAVSSSSSSQNQHPQTISLSSSTHMSSSPHQTGTATGTAVLNMFDQAQSSDSASTTTISASSKLSPDNALSAAQTGVQWHYAYDALWTGTAPKMDDVKQGKIDNCWEPATALAILHISPDWLTHLFYYSDGTPMAGQNTPSALNVTVQLWNPNTGNAQNFSNVNIYNESTTEDNPGGVWWHSAINQAETYMAGETFIYGMTGSGFTQSNGDPAFPLAMYTGKAVTTTAISDYGNMTAFFSDMTMGNRSPVVISTKSAVGSTTPTIVANHDYAVLYTTDPGGDDPTGTSRTVTVRNPWGTTDTFLLKDLWDNIYWLNRFTNWDTLVWETG